MAARSTPKSKAKAEEDSQKRAKCGRLLWKYKREHCVGTGIQDPERCEVNGQSRAYYSHYKDAFDACKAGRSEYERECIGHIDIGHANWTKRLTEQSSLCNKQIENIKALSKSMHAAKLKNEQDMAKSMKGKSAKVAQVAKASKAANASNADNAANEKHMLYLNELKKKDIDEQYQMICSEYYDLFSKREYAEQFIKKKKLKKDSELLEEYAKLVEGHRLGRYMPDINIAVFDARIKELDIRAEEIRKEMASKEENELLNHMILEKNSRLQTMTLDEKNEYIKSVMEQIQIERNNLLKSRHSYDLEWANKMYSKYIVPLTDELDKLLFKRKLLEGFKKSTSHAAIDPEVFRYSIDSIYGEKCRRLIKITSEVKSLGMTIDIAKNLKSEIQRIHDTRIRLRDEAISIINTYNIYKNTNNKDILDDVRIAAVREDLQKVLSYNLKYNSEPKSSTRKKKKKAKKGTRKHSPSRSLNGSPSRSPSGSSSRSLNGSPTRSSTKSPSGSPTRSPSRSPSGSPSKSPSKSFKNAAAP